MTRRAQLICDSPNALQDENDYFQRVFHKNNYNSDFIKLNTYKNTDEHNETNNPTTVTATMPYIKDTSEKISRILRPYNIRVAHKPITTLRHILTNVKDREQPNDRQGEIYKIKCADCRATYNGETGRNLRLTYE